LFWCLVGGIVGAIIGQSKHRAPWEAGLLGVLLGLIGVLIVAVLPRVAETERRAFNMVWLAALLAGTSYVIALVLLIGPAETRQDADARVQAVPRTPPAQSSAPPMPVIWDRGASATGNHHPMREIHLRRPPTMHKPHSETHSVQPTHRPRPNPQQTLVRRHQPSPTVAQPGTSTQPVTTEPPAPPSKTTPSITPGITTSATASIIPAITPSTTPTPATAATVVAPSPPTPPSLVAPSPPTSASVVAPTSPTPPVVVTPTIP
jgi:hypothetical protein